MSLNAVVEALIERGYNPYAQLKGYVLNNSPCYITSYNNARDIIKTVDIEFIDDYLTNWDRYQDGRWKREFIEKYS